MFTSLSITNFRGFQELKVEPLDRINLIAGKNDVGKTSLLEAIYLHCNPCTPTALLQVNEQRGVSDPQIEDVGSWTFSVPSRAALTASTDTGGIGRTAELAVIDSQTAQRPEYDDARKLFVSALRPEWWTSGARHVVMRYSDTQGRSGLGVGVATDHSFPQIRQLYGSPTPCLFITARDQLIGLELRPSDEPATILFNDIEREGRQQEVLSILRILEPRLTDLALLLFNRKTTINAQIEGMQKKVPLAFVGEGLVRLLLLSLGIARAAGGVVLIDEVEKGLHYSVLTRIWTAIREAARRLDVQVFATTHSWECIRTAHEAFSEDGPYDLRLHRLDRIDGQTRAVTYNQRTLGTSVEMAMEVR